jgi:hypothetical protein
MIKIICFYLLYDGNLDTKEKNHFKNVMSDSDRGKPLRTLGRDYTFFSPE